MSATGYAYAKRLRYYASEEIDARLSTFLNIWVMSCKLGRVTGYDAGFILPNIEEDDLEKRNVRSPDVSFGRADRLKKTKRDFVELVPDLMVEIKSRSDRIKPLEEKIQLFLQLRSVVGILIRPLAKVTQEDLILGRQSS
ncbi:Uma2 family endonuclease [Nostoc sp. LEGE 12450]|nr:Uma2 family endonuclease [Nostoc sp. LEGE 12450]